MRGTVGVVVGTYGDPDVWGPLSKRALASIEAQTSLPDDYVSVHSDSLRQARNGGAAILDTDYLIFLDADDELDPRYVEEMRNALSRAHDPWIIYRPSTFGIYEDGTCDGRPAMIPSTDLKRTNCIVIGAMCPKDMFHEVGGFKDYPILEDWALWRAMVAEGAIVKEVPHAIYRVHVRPQSRNTDHGLHRGVYSRILKEVPL